MAEIDAIDRVTAMEPTTESIVQWLRQCASDNGCKGCPYHEPEIPNCFDLLKAAAADRLEAQQQELNETSEKPSAEAEFFGRLRVDSPDLKLMLPRGALKAAGIGFGDCVGVIIVKDCISLLKYAHDPYKTAKHYDFSKHVRQEDTHESNPD